MRIISNDTMLMKRYSYRSKRKLSGITTVLSGVEASSEANVVCKWKQSWLLGQWRNRKNHSYLLGRLYRRKTLSLSLSCTMNIYILPRIGPRCVFSKENPTIINHVPMWVNKYLTQTCKYTCVSPTLYCHVSIKWNAEVGLFLFIMWFGKLLKRGTENGMENRMKRKHLQCDINILIRINIILSL